MKALFKMMSCEKYQEILNKIHIYEKQTNNAIQFINKIESGELEIQFDSSDANNELAKALLSMQAKMSEIAQKEQQRNWVSEGLAKFSQILREDKQNLQEFGYSVISNVVKYLKANQGGLFIKNADDSTNTEYLELMAAYAYNKKKYLEKKIELDEGLVGQCFMEQDYIYMTDVPKDYVEITSGLGEATPTTILLLPVKLNEEVFGVIELASFNYFEPYQIEFLQKLGENIASAISSVKIAEKTNQLLAEAQNQAEELRAQEEELRQNMEEIEATNEEMQRQKKELESKDKELQKVIAEMEANEQDMQRTEDKSRKIVKEFLTLKKESKIKDQEISEKDERILELENLLKMRKSA